MSNCVLNLATDKGAVLRGVKRLLKPGGEFYFADVYADRRLPAEVRNDHVLYGECLGGALYWKDFLRLARAAGFADPRLVDDRPISLTDPRIQALVGEARFFSATYRLFNIDSLEDACEDHGQAMIYRGTIPNYPHRLDLDGHHAIETGRTFAVCGNTYRMLHESRFAEHFIGVGDFSRHYGLFAGCGESLPFASGSYSQSAEAAGCC